MEFKDLSKIDQRFKDDYRKVLYSNPKDKPPKSLSRIEIYQSGASRIFRCPDSPPPDNILTRRRNDIITFSYETRKRLYRYINSLDFTGFNVVSIEFTISTFLSDFLTLENFRLTLKRLFKIIQRKGIDYVYKIEYTENRIPHLHTLFYSRSFFWTSKDERIDFSNKMGCIFTDTLFNSLGLSSFIGIDDNLLDCYQKMCKACVHVKKPKDLIRFVHYLSYYIGKDKDYQNIQPEIYKGLKFWGYGVQNYGKINKDHTEIEITKEVFDSIYSYIAEIHHKSIASNCSRNKLNCSKCRKKSCILYRKNGFFLSKPYEVLDKLNLKDRISY